MRHFRFALLLALLSVSTQVNATTYIVPSDRALVHRARAVVVASTVGSRSEVRDDGEIYTVTQFSVRERIKGSVPVDQPLYVAGIGGAVGDRYQLAFGVPQFRSGEEALLFLTKNRFGEWAVLGFELGAFEFSTGRSGQRYLVRGTDITGWDEEGMQPHAERVRDAERFLAFVRGVARGNPITADYIVDSPELAKREIETNASPTAYLQTAIVNGVPTGFRWQNDGSATFETNGVQTGFTLGTVDNAMDAWNSDPTTPVNYSRGGTTSAGFTIDDGTNAIVFNGTMPAEAGGSAVGFAKISGGGLYTTNGTQFISTTEGDVIIKAGFTNNAKLLDEVVTHELGHTLGFRHSDQGTPSSGTAVMNSVSFGNFGASLQAWDIEALNAVYGAGAPSCTAPSITTQPQGDSINSGQSTSMSVGASGTAPLSFQWFRGNSGNTASPVNGATSATLNTGALTQTTSFWVRVSNSCGTADSASATVTVSTTCTGPSIIAQPQSASVFSGGSATLSVTVNGTTPFSFQWFRGNSGDTSSPVAGGNQQTLFTPALTQPASFWVRVSNNCGTVDSAAANVTIATCDPISITLQPQSQQVTSGGSVVLQVGANGSTPFTFQWFRGGANDTSRPVGSNNFTLNTGALTQTTSFWVRISNCAGSVDSSVATITVAASCVAPQITSTSPTAPINVGTGGNVTLGVQAAGTTLAFQWFRGTAPDASNPISGATTSTFNTGALTATTNFWVRVTNSCGTANSATFTVNVSTCDVHITTQPASANIRPGRSSHAVGTGGRYGCVDVPVVPREHG